LARKDVRLRTWGASDPLGHFPESIALVQLPEIAAWSSREKRRVTQAPVQIRPVLPDAKERRWQPRLLFPRPQGLMQWLADKDECGIGVLRTTCSPNPALRG